MSPAWPRPTIRYGHALEKAVGLAVTVAVLSASGLASPPPAIPTPAQPSLVRTDGHPLPPKLPALSKKAQKRALARGREACRSKCITPFGTLLGEVDGVKSFSNCRSACIKPEFSFLDLQSERVVVGTENPDAGRYHYIGVVHQCVEYARKWWMLKRRQTFGSVDSAFEILYLRQGKNIDSASPFLLGRSLNGSAQRAPQRGDLVIYAPDRKFASWRHGHVAVVVGLDLDAGFLFVAEENYNNHVWEKPGHYARKLLIRRTAKGVLVTDRNPNLGFGQTLGKISGWIYPKAP